MKILLNKFNKIMNFYMLLTNKFKLNYQNIETN